MKFIIALIGIVLYYLWMDVLNALKDNTPKSYEELMKMPSFAQDEELQKKLTRNVDEMG